MLDLQKCGREQYKLPQKHCKILFVAIKMLQPQERRIKFSLRLTYMSRMMYLTAVTLTTFFYEMDNWKLSQTF